MVDFRAFVALRPAAGRASAVAAVPYDVVNTEEARALAAGNPDSLLHATRPEIDLPEGTDPHSDAVYAQAQVAFADLQARGALVRADGPALFAYALTREGHTQLGLMGSASSADYQADRIKKHEFTRPAKEDDRMRHIQAVRAHLGPVFLAYRATESIDAQLARIAAGPAEVDFVAPDGVRHQIWAITGADEIAALERAFAELGALYIADGHHRAAAANRVGQAAPAGTEHDAQRRFLAVAFPHDQLRILPYNRVVADLHGHTPETLLAALAADFDVSELAGPEAPSAPLSYSMCLAGRWYALALKADKAPADVVARLDVSVLQDKVLSPLLGIGDPRRDERIDFVGGIRGVPVLAQRAGASGVAFALYPTPMEALMDVADEGHVMPPKSTWFEPKLRSGLVISTF